MSEAAVRARGGSRVIAGWVVSVLVSLPFVPSAVFKLMKNPQALDGLGHIGLDARGVVLLGVVELLVVVIYLVPPTAVLGAVLMTGYLGGALVAHLTFHISLVVPIVLGVAAWAGLWLREPRLRALLPLR